MGRGVGVGGSGVAVGGSVGVSVGVFVGVSWAPVVAVASDAAVDGSLSVGGDVVAVGVVDPPQASVTKTKVTMMLNNNQRCFVFMGT